MWIQWDQASCVESEIGTAFYMGFSFYTFCSQRIDSDTTQDQKLPGVVSQSIKNCNCT